MRAMRTSMWVVWMFNSRYTAHISGSLNSTQCMGCPSKGRLVLLPENHQKSPISTSRCLVATRLKVKHRDELKRLRQMQRCAKPGNTTIRKNPYMHKWENRKQRCRQPHKVTRRANKSNENPTTGTNPNESAKVKKNEQFIGNLKLKNSEVYISYSRTIQSRKEKSKCKNAGWIHFTILFPAILTKQLQVQQGAHWKKACFPTNELHGGAHWSKTNCDIGTKIS